MSDDLPGSELPGEGCPPKDRVESWEEIAAYLDRDVRTVQHWQKRHGLPVRALGGGAQSGPYACRHELDAWRDSRSRNLEKDEQGGASSRRYVRWALAGAALAAGATVGVWLLRPSPLAFGEGDWILITGFANRTGQPLFDDVVNPALVRTLLFSRHLRIVSGERAADALRLMGKPPEATVDARLGREICLCDGGIRAMLAGRIEPAGSACLLTTALIDPSREVTVARNTQRFLGGDQLPAAVLRVSDWLREKLGESRASIRRNRRSPQAADAISLPSLQCYARGLAAAHCGKYPEAESRFRNAVELDPGHAGARAALCWSIWKQAGDARRDECLPHARAAYELAAGSNDPELHFIAGLHHWLRGEAHSALAELDVQTRTRPDHYWTADLAAQIAAGLEGREREHIRYALHAAEIRPHSLSDRQRAARARDSLSGPGARRSGL